MNTIMKRTGWMLIAVIAMTAAGYAQTNEPTAEAEVIVATEEGVPGGVVLSTLEIQAKVVAIDYESREASLLLPGGAVEVIKVGPAAVNFDQIKKGDMVNAVVSEELVIGMAPDGADLQDGEAVMVMAAAPGEAPGAIAADTIRVTATVVAIDGELRTARLRFEDGREKTVVVRDDIDLTRHSVGEKVVFQISTMVALSVEKATAD